MKRYDNGELVTKNRMEDEDWYYDLYQPFLEFVIGFNSSDVNKIYKSGIKFFKKRLKHTVTEKEKEMLLRWSVLQAERKNIKIKVGGKWY